MVVTFVTTGHSVELCNDYGGCWHGNNFVICYIVFSIMYLVVVTLMMMWKVMSYVTTTACIRCSPRLFAVPFFYPGD